jgi:iron complex outermembrane receptor protein
MIRSPKFTGNIGATYRHELDSGSALTANMTVSHNSGFFWEPDNRLTQPSYENVSASLRYDFPDNRYAVQAWARNLTNSFIMSNATAAASDVYAPSEPRTYGITLSAKFGG